MTKSSNFMEYIKLHLISLEQDLEGLSEQMEMHDEDSKAYRGMDEEYLYLSGQIGATRHLLSVATDIMNSSNERYNND